MNDKEKNEVLMKTHEVLLKTLEGSHISILCRSPADDKKFSQVAFLSNDNPALVVSAIVEGLTNHISELTKKIDELKSSIIQAPFRG